MRRGLGSRVWREAHGRRAGRRQRVAAFLQPQDALYFEAGARAVACYDHRFLLQPAAAQAP